MSGKTKKYVLIAISLLTVVSSAVYFGYKIKTENNHEARFFSNNKDCQGEKLVFDYPPVNLEKTKIVVPLGLMSSNHVTPVDHQYFQDFSNTEPDIEVYSPGEGRITLIEYMSGTRSDNGSVIEWADYRITIEHSCRILSMYIHIDKLSEKLAQFAPPVPGYKPVDIPVEEGEVIGWYQNNVDYNLVDTKVMLEGLLVPEHYLDEPWKVHVPDTFEYFNDEIVNKMIEKSLRSKEPYAGRLDWDIDGRLRGNWFREGGGYYNAVDKMNYWEDHLSFSPDYLDHDHIIISIGDYDGVSEQFAVRRNSPDPADVSVGRGLVKYELVNYDHYTDEGIRWNRRNFAKIEEARNDEQVFGVVLVEMLEDRKLRFEVFPGKTAEEVSGFSENSTIYTR